MAVHRGQRVRHLIEMTDQSTLSSSFFLFFFLSLSLPTPSSFLPCLPSVSLLLLSQVLFFFSLIGVEVTYGLLYLAVVLPMCVCSESLPYESGSEVACRVRLLGTTTVAYQAPSLSMEFSRHK